MKKHSFAFITLLRYLGIRGEFRKYCNVLNTRYVEVYKRPVRTMICIKHRALVSRRQTGHPIDSIAKKQPTYVSGFCCLERCVWEGTCSECIHNIIVEKLL